MMSGKVMTIAFLKNQKVPSSKNVACMNFALKNLSSEERRELLGFQQRGTFISNWDISDIQGLA